MANVAADIYVDGFVQGVGFRHFAYQKSKECGVYGFVRNLRDGRVLVFAEGDQGCMDRFLAAIRRGPPGAKVRSLHLEQKAYTGEYREFTVLFDM
ncbi:acylphosphatase [bacterium]|nr:acylphosphatase [bacterium]